MKRLLDSLGQGRRSATKQSGPSDQRTTYRYPAVDNDARLAWWEGEQFREVPARLIDFSQGGALVIAPEVPATTEFYLRLLQPTETEWALASVVRVVRGGKGLYRIGAEFAQTCPYEVFTKLRGYQLEYKSGPESPEFDGLYWR